jgi:hypothetical protein
MVENRNVTDTAEPGVIRQIDELNLPKRPESTLG